MGNITPVSEVVAHSSIHRLEGTKKRADSYPEGFDRMAALPKSGKHGISSATFYEWKGKYGGLEVSDAKRLKALEHENVKLKKLLAEAVLGNAMLKEIAAKKW